VRMIEGGWRFEGDETLGLNPDDNGEVEISPLLSAQVGAIIIGRVLYHLRKRILTQFEELITKKRTANWLTIFITTFILMDNYERIIKYQRTIALERRSSVCERFRGLNTPTDFLVPVYKHALN
jgi:hypothetical protein